MKEFLYTFATIIAIGLAWWNISSEIGAVGDKLTTRVGAVEGNLTDRIDRTNERVDTVNQSLIGLQGQVSETKATLETFIDEHIRNH